MTTQHKIGVYLDADEKEAVQRAASLVGMTASNYIRDKLGLEPKRMGRPSWQEEVAKMPGPAITTL